MKEENSEWKGRNRQRRKANNSKCRKQKATNDIAEDTNGVFFYRLQWTRVVQIDRRRRRLLTSEAARCCQKLVTASGITRRHISEANSHQSRRLENLKFSLQVA